MWPEPLVQSIWDKAHVLTAEDADYLISFLEIDPFFFRSGYVKQKAITRLRKCPLSARDRKRIAAIIERAVLAGKERNLTDWLRLTTLCEPDHLEPVVRMGMASADGVVVRKAILLGLTLMNMGREAGELKRNNYPWGTAHRIVQAKFCS